MTARAGSKGDEQVCVRAGCCALRRQIVDSWEPECQRLNEQNQAFRAVLELVLEGLHSGTVKSKPLLDTTDLNAESLPVRSLQEIILAALGPQRRS